MPEPWHSLLKYNVLLNDIDKFSSHFTPNTTVLTKLTAVVRITRNTYIHRVGTCSLLLKTRFQLYAYYVCYSK